MAVAAVGTPAAIVTSATSPVTGSWGTGQNRTAGHLLIACVTAGAGTSAGAIANSGGTWTQIGEANQNGYQRVAFFYKVAAGSDTAPAFTSTLSGTGPLMSCTLWELSGQAASSFIQTFGTGGTSSGSAASATTSGNVTNTGSYALGGFGQQRTSSQTETHSITAPFTVQTSYGSAAYCHAATAYLSNPSTGSTLTTTDTFNRANGNAAAMVVVVAPPVSANVNGVGAPVGSAGGVGTADGVRNADITGVGASVTSQGGVGNPHGGGGVEHINSVSIGNGAAGQNVTTTIPAGTGILAGDVLYVIGHSQNGHSANGMSVRDELNQVNFTTIKETDQGGSSSHWMQTFYYKTPQDIPDGTQITFTGYSGATLSAFCLDVFRGLSGSISQAVTDASTSSNTNAPIPALGSPPPANDLVLTACSESSGSPTVASPFTLGSRNTTQASVACGYVIGADGASNYYDLDGWTLGTSNTSASQTVAFAKASTGSANVNGVAASVSVSGSTGTASGAAAATGTGASAGVSGGVGAILGAANVTGIGASVTTQGGIGTAFGGSGVVDANVNGVAAAVSVQSPSGTPHGNAGITGIGAPVTSAAGAGTPHGSQNLTGIGASVTVQGGVGVAYGGVSGAANVNGVAASVGVAGGAGTASAGAGVSGVGASMAVAGGVGVARGAASVVGVASSVMTAAAAGTASAAAGVTGTGAAVTTQSPAGTPRGAANVAGIGAPISVQGGIGVPYGEQLGNVQINGVAASVAVAAGVGQAKSGVNVTGVGASVSAQGGVGVFTANAGVTGTAAHLTAVAPAGTWTGNANVNGVGSSVLLQAGVGSLRAAAGVQGIAALVSVLGGTGVALGRGTLYPGTVKTGNELAHSVLVTNTGTGSVEISNILADNVTVENVP